MICYEGRVLWAQLVMYHGKQYLLLTFLGAGVLFLFLFFFNKMSYYH